jgi:hypothetical protein
MSSNATVSSSNKAKSLLTSGYLGISTNLILFDIDFKTAFQSKSA